MCGLAGVIGTIDADARNAFTALLVLAQTRGTDATGIAGFRKLKKRNTWTVFKDQVPASELTKKADYKKVLNGKDVYYLMGHTRLATTGNPVHNGNNHPIVIGDVVGTHNGVIWNADSLFKKWNFSRTHTVDSEILFQIANFALSKNGIELPKFGEMLAACSGSMAMAFASLLCPNIYLLTDSDTPLYGAYSKKRGLFMYSSVEAHLKAVTGFLRDGNWEFQEVPEYTMLSIDPVKLEWTEHKLPLPKRTTTWNRFVAWDDGEYDYDRDRWWEKYNTPTVSAKALASTASTATADITKSPLRDLDIVPGKPLPTSVNGTFYYAFAKMTSDCAKVYKSGQTAPEYKNGGSCITCSHDRDLLTDMCAQLGYWTTSNCYVEEGKALVLTH